MKEIDVFILDVVFECVFFFGIVQTSGLAKLGYCVQGSCDMNYNPKRDSV